MVQAVEQMHAAGFAHKDVKVEHCHFGINADGTQVLKLLEFGIALHLQGDLSHTTSIVTTI